MDSRGRGNSQAGGSSGLSGREDLGQHFERLRAVVPSLDETDERSILEKTEEYLRNINEETWKIERELSEKKMESHAHGGDINSPPCIQSMAAEKMGEGSFVVKVNWRGQQMAGRVQAMLESCGLDITQTSIATERAPNMCTTAFVKVEQIGMTEDQLYGIIYQSAARIGMLP